MSQELRDLMVRTAESAPTVSVDPATWRSARRARRRERLLVPLAAAVVLVGVGGIASQGGSLLRGSDHASPAAGRTEPAMPSHVYSVPGHVDGVLGEELRAHPAGETLAVGVTAVAFTTAHNAPVAVSAVNGEYHLLDLPGYDRVSGLRFEGTLALSPDGQRLAYTWNKMQGDGSGESYVPSGVRIVDLLTGEVASHQVRKGYGVFSHELSWSPNGRYLAYNTQIANSSQTGTRGVRNFFVERLDTQTGERLRASGMPMRDAAPAVTNSGTVVTGSDTTLWRWRPGLGTRRVDLARSSAWRGSVMSIGTLAETERVLVSAGAEYSRLYVGYPDRPGSFRRISDGARSLSPVGPVDGEQQVIFEQTPTSTALWTIRATGPLLNDRSGVLVTFDEELGEQYSFATSLLQRPTRDVPAPDWPMSTDQKLLLGGLAAAGLLGLLGWFRHRLRRRPKPVVRLADRA